MQAVINYAARTDFRQRYYANDHARDTVVIDGRAMPIADGRSMDLALDAAGFCLVLHRSAVADFEDKAAVAAVYNAEIELLLHDLTGADAVQITAPGIVRFSERSGRAGELDNSNPARFVHIDATAATSANFVARGEHPPLARYAHFNVWRAFSGAPQDVPLALCDARSVAEEDLLIADAIFDPPGGAPEWRFESWIIAHNPAHQWAYFPNMTRDEVIVFKTSDSIHHNAVPHVAFDNPLTPPDCHPRASIEMRALALWHA